MTECLVGSIETIAIEFTSNDSVSSPNPRAIVVGIPFARLPDPALRFVLEHEMAHIVWHHTKFFWANLIKSWLIDYFRLQLDLRQEQAADEKAAETLQDEKWSAGESLQATNEVFNLP